MESISKYFPERVMKTYNTPLRKPLHTTPLNINKIPVKAKGGGSAQNNSKSPVRLDLSFKHPH